MKRKNKSKIKFLPGERKVDFKKEIRRTARMILEMLARAGKMKVADLHGKTKLPPYMVYSAMYLLIMEDNVFISRVKRTLYIRLLFKRKPAKKRR